MDKVVKMYNEDFNLILTDIPQLSFLDFDEEGIEVQENTLEIKGKDGVIVGPSTFGPFNLILRFYYNGSDLEDYNLFKQRLRGLLFRRKPYYIVHSDIPGKKYAVYCKDNAITDIGTKYGTFEVTFVVFKGYSESLKDTLDTEFLSDNWQFENGLITDKDIKYIHSNKRFMIWNGSYDTIDPLNHRLIINIKGNAPNGFKMTNHHTGETFEYYGSLTNSQTLTLNGIYPIKDSNRVGFETNFEWISLAPGENNIEIEGLNLSDLSVEFQFNFIYR